MTVLLIIDIIALSAKRHNRNGLDKTQNVKEPWCVKCGLIFLRCFILLRLICSYNNCVNYFLIILCLYILYDFTINTLIL